MLSGCLYTDANNTCINPVMKLLSTITNYKTSTILNKYVNLLVLTYRNNGYSIFLNDWKDSNYFTAVFLTEFFWH